MRFLLGAHRARLSPPWIEEPRLLGDRAAVFENADLSTRLDVDRLANEADGVDVLDFAARAERRAGAAHGDVDVGAQRTLLHVAVAGADVAQDRPQLRNIGARLLRRTQVGLGDDLHERDAAAIEIDVAFGRRKIMQRLAGVLLEMQTLDAHGDALARRYVDDHGAFADDRVLVLRDLVALRQVGIEIVLAVENRTQVDLGL